MCTATNNGTGNILQIRRKKVKQENILNIRHLRNERETGSSLRFAKTSGTVTGEFTQRRF